MEKIIIENTIKKEGEKMEIVFTMPMCRQGNRWFIRVPSKFEPYITSKKQRAWFRCEQIDMQAGVEPAAQQTECLLVEELQNAQQEKKEQVSDK